MLSEQEAEIQQLKSSRCVWFEKLCDRRNPTGLWILLVLAVISTVCFIIIACLYEKTYYGPYHCDNGVTDCRNCTASTGVASCPSTCQVLNCQQCLKVSSQSWTCTDAYQNNTDNVLTDLLPAFIIGTFAAGIVIVSYLYVKIKEHL